MEVAGLAVGIGGLAGLFSTSLEVIHKMTRGETRKVNPGL